MPAQSTVTLVALTILGEERLRECEASLGLQQSTNPQPGNDLVIASPT